eukprot:Sspe_Gene.25919::Locus_10535_Transcript_1_1_Confidence_1.000_Length_623::g.25919::m.25919
MGIPSRNAPCGAIVKWGVEGLNPQQECHPQNPQTCKGCGTTGWCDHRTLNHHSLPPLPATAQPPFLPQPQPPYHVLSLSTPLSSPLLPVPLMSFCFLSFPTLSVILAPFHLPPPPPP